MNYFVDTSAIIKKYIKENGSLFLAELLANVDIIYVADITLIECISAIRRLYSDRFISKNDYLSMKNEMFFDFDYYSIIPFSSNIENFAISMIDKYQLKPLDSIQLASALVVKQDIESFIGSDKILNKACKKENIKVVDPIKS